MSDENDGNLLSYTKAILKFLVNERKGVQTVQSLNLDFYNYTGRNIPFYDLGYSYLVTFLDTIPDTLTVNFDTLEVKPSQASSHTTEHPYFRNIKNVQCASFCHVIQPPTFIYQPKLLPWVNPLYLDRPIESNKKLFRPITKSNQEPKGISVGDDKTTTISLGPRSYGDGKCSTPDLRKSDQDSESTEKMDMNHYTLLEKDCSDCPDRDPDVKNSDGKYSYPNLLKIDQVAESTELINTNDHTLLEKNCAYQGPDVKNYGSVDFDDDDDDDTPLLNHCSDLSSDQSSDRSTNQIFDRSADVENGDQKIVYMPLIGTELNEWEDSEFEEKSENKSELSFSTCDTSAKKSRKEYVSTSSVNTALFDVSITPPPVYSENDLIHNDKVVSGTDNLRNSFFNDDESSLSEKEFSQCSENDAVPSFSEDDDPIYMIDSGFSNEKYGAKYKTRNIEDIMEVGRFYELYISEVHNPYKFWFQLADEEPNAVDEMQENLNSYYSMTSSHHSEDLIKEVHIRKGYACAALYENIWHRAEILEQPLRGTVNVFFVDYGTIDQVAITDLRYLLDIFCIAPKLCHRGTLDFVKPTNHRWDVNATHFFISLVGDKKLVTGVSEIDSKSNSARLYLMDRNNVININHKLVYDGFAYPYDPRDRYKVHMAEAVPSFDSLEKGQHPSYEEANALLKQGYDIEREVQSKIIDGIDYYIPQHISDAETLQRAENFRREREKAKLLAKQRDATVFLQFFEGILQNPFLNGMMTNILDESL